MTEKQYDVIDKEEPRGQSVTWNGIPCTARTCVTRLNRLTEENEQLKKEIRNLRDFRGFITEKNVLNEKERKELQLQMLRLYNYFKDWFEDTMSPNAFSEMWDNVKEDERWEND